MGSIEILTMVILIFTLSLILKNDNKIQSEFQLDPHLNK
jgi:hypothetical protein